MSMAVGSVNSIRELAAEVAETLLRIENDMEFRAAKKGKYWDDSKPAHWRMSERSRECLVELRLRMERAQI